MCPSYCRFAYTKYISLARQSNPGLIHVCVGAVVNIANRHWVALREVEGTIWLFDSQEAAPARLSYDAYIEFIAEYTGAYPIMSI